MAERTPESGPPDEWFTHHRWIRQQDAEWVQDSNKILLEYGKVQGRTVYEKEHIARQRANRLIDLMIRMRLHERWELRRHVERYQGGWIWSIEYLGGGNVRARIRKSADR